MPSNPSPVADEVVRRVAALARLRVPDRDLPGLTGQLNRIVSYIDQLKEIRQEPSRPEGLAATPVRPDVALAGGGQEALRTNGSPLLHGHGAVPRVVKGGEP